MLLNAALCRCEIANYNLCCATSFRSLIRLPPVSLALNYPTAYGLRLHPNKPFT